MLKPPSLGPPYPGLKLFIVIGLFPPQILNKYCDGFQPTVGLRLSRRWPVCTYWWTKWWTSLIKSKWSIVKSKLKVKSNRSLKLFIVIGLFPPQVQGLSKGDEAEKMVLMIMIMIGINTYVYIYIYIYIHIHIYIYIYIYIYI